MSFFKKFKNLFESPEEKQDRLDRERRERQAKEAAEAEGGLELTIDEDNTYDDHVGADAADTERAAAREAERAAAAAAHAAKEAEIPEAQEAIKLLTEYWKNMNEYKAQHMNKETSLLSNDYSIQLNRPNKNWQKVHDACQAAAAAYRYKYEHSQDMEEKKLFEKKFQKYESYEGDVYMSMRRYDDNKGMYNVQLGIFPLNRKYQGGKKSKYSRKLKSKYSRKSKSKYSRKSKSKYSRKSKSKSKSKYSRKY
jgi:hypothetical protein